MGPSRVFAQVDECSGITVLVCEFSGSVFLVRDVLSHDLGVDVFRKLVDRGDDPIHPL